MGKNMKKRMNTKRRTILILRSHLMILRDEDEVAGGPEQDVEEEVVEDGETGEAIGEILLLSSMMKRTFQALSKVQHDNKLWKERRNNSLYFLSVKYYSPQM